MATTLATTTPDALPIAPRPPERLLRIKEVELKVALVRSTIYRKLAMGVFPMSVTVGNDDEGGGVRWRESEIDAWIAGLPYTARPQPRASAS